MSKKSEKKMPKLRFPEFTDDWEQRKLSELSEKTFGGGTPKTSNESFWKGNIPWIQSSDLIEGSLLDVEPRKYISQEAVNKSATKLVPENSVAIVTRVGVGKLAFMPFSYATSQDFLSLSVLKTEPQFTVYALYKKLQSELNAVQGTSIKGVTKDELLAKEIMIPCYEEQEKIGSYLHSLDHLITLHQRKIEKLKEYKKGMLQKMFPKNGEKIPEVRFPGFTDDWEQRKFGDDNDLITGYPFESEKFSEDGIKLVRGMNVKRGYLDFSNDICMRWNSTDGLENYLLEADDILIQMDGALIGKSYAKIAKEQLPALLVQRVTRARTRSKDACADFMYQTIQRDFLRYIVMNKTETAVPHLSLNDICNFKIMIPCLEEQQQIGAYFSNLDHLITLHQRKLEILKQFKKGCLQQMFM